MAERASEVRSLLPCPRCGRSLVPAPVESTVVFHCKTGHEFALGDLLRAQSEVIKGGLELLLSEWNHQHQALVDTVKDARKNGYLDVAEIFDRHAKSLESRISKIRNVYSQPDSSRLMKLPDALRTA